MNAHRTTNYHSINQSLTPLVRNEVLHVSDNYHHSSPLCANGLQERMRKFSLRAESDKFTLAKSQLNWDSSGGGMLRVGCQA